MLSVDDIKDVAVAAKLNQLIINILARIKHQKMDFIVFVKNVEMRKIKRSDNLNGFK